MPKPKRTDELSKTILELRQSARLHRNRAVTLFFRDRKRSIEEWAQNEALAAQADQLETERRRSKKEARHGEAGV